MAKKKPPQLTFTCLKSAIETQEGTWLKRSRQNFKGKGGAATLDKDKKYVYISLIQIKVNPS